MAIGKGLLVFWNAGDRSAAAGPLPPGRWTAGRRRTWCRPPRRLQPDPAAVPLDHPADQGQADPFALGPPRGVD